MRLGRALPLLPATCSLALLGMACVSGGLPTTHYYTLGVPGERLPGDALAGRAADGEGTVGLVMAVESLGVTTPYDQDRIVYRKSLDSTEVGFYAYHRWTAPLGRLAQVALIAGLEGSPGIRALGPAGSGGPFGAVLGGRFLHVEEIVGSPGSPASASQVRLAFELELRTTTGQTLWTDRFGAVEPGAFSSGGEVAGAMHRLFEALLLEVRRGLPEALATLATHEASR